MRTRLSRAGFTLIELMVTIAIIGIAVATVIPSIAQAMRDRRVQQSGIHLMDPFRVARTRAMLRGSAHLVSMVYSGAALDGYVFEGNTTSCRLSNWGSALVPGTVPVVGPWEVYRTPRDNPADQITHTIINPVGAASLQVCYTPSGRTFYRTTPGSPWSESNTVGGAGGGSLNGGFLFQVQTSTGTHVSRRVYVPLGGAPRMWQ